MRHLRGFAPAVALLLCSPLLFSAEIRANRYALILTSTPAAQRLMSASAVRGGAGQDYIRRVKTAQLAVQREVERRHFAVTGSTQILLNAVFVQAGPGREADLRSIPGVAAVVPLRSFHRHMDRAVQLENVPAAWAALGGTGNAGAGVKIGILDTGIDQTHPAFQDPSLSVPAGFPKCSGSDCAFTNNKVIVARSYVPLLAAGTPPNPAQDSRPDDVSARDRVGHGTALGMIAAGVTSTGPAATITGMAPKAWLGSYKVFGSPGLNDFTGGDVIISALEDAYKDGMDVAVLSLGGPALTGPLDTGAICGAPSNTPCDAEATAVENAIRSGMLVVISAGNSGDSGQHIPTLNTIESPATAPSAIAAGASTNSHMFVSGVRITGANVPSNLQFLPAIFGDGPLPPSPLVAPLRDVASLDPTGTACDPLPAGSFNGAIVVILRSPGQCTFEVKIQHAQVAGAVGAIFVQVSGSSTIFAPGGLTGTQIPAAMIGSDQGTALKTLLRSNSSLQATLDPSLSPVDTSLYNTLADFSSRGPSISYLLKPEMVAVGTDLYMATQNFDPNGEMYDPSRYTVAQGTSFSAPMIAGAAALVKQANPSYTAAQLKSAVVNTATQEITQDGAPASALMTGNGKLDAGDAIRAAVTVDTPAISFGAVDQTTRFPVSVPLKIHNAGSAAAILNLSVAPSSTSPAGPVPTVDRTSFSIAPGADQTVTVTLPGPLPAPGDYDGAITIQGAGAALRVPYAYFVGDGAPFNAIPIIGDVFDGTVNQPLPEGGLAFKVVDQYGVAVPNVAVTWRAGTGGGVIRAADSQTDAHGVATADVLLGSTPGPQRFTATAGGLTMRFAGNARVQPVITSVADSATLLTTPGIAPGSYITLFGNGLSDDTEVETTLSYPLALNFVSVSFDVPSANLSLPGRILYVSPTQVNVQAPWELAGQKSVFIKVTIDFTYGQVFQAAVTQYSPGIFVMPSGFGAARDENFAVIDNSNPAKRGHVIQLYANGLGPVQNQPPTGEPSNAQQLSTTIAAPTVTIGGKPATVQYSGLAPTYPALYQLNVVVPSDVAPGVQPVALSIGGVAAPTVNIPVQ